jgi:ferredoxin
MFSHLFNILVRGRARNRKAPSLDSLLETTDSHLENLETLILPAPESKPRTPFDTDLPPEQMSMLNTSPRQRLKIVPKVLPLYANMQIGARMYDEEFQAKANEASPEFIHELEEMARRLGAKDIGYVKAPRNAIFQDKGIPCEYAVVFTVEMDKEPMDTAPSFECQLEVMDGYKRMASISKKLARFMRKNGFAAYPGTALGGITDYVYLAELAGLGAIGYHGLLITPGEGARLRINTIYTNIKNLPIKTENEHLWVRDFCAMCNKCIRQCPVDAIFDEPQPRGDGGMQTIDHDACRDYFARNFGCAICLAVCPFSQAGYDKVKSRFKGNPHAPQFRIPVATNREANKAESVGILERAF